MTEAGVAVEVEVDPATAFDLFTRDIAAWWRADRSLWGETADELRFENGALMQGDAEIGRVSAWEPGPRLAFSYGPPGVDPAERTDVEVRFEAVRGGTRVVVRHGGWEKANWAGLLAGFARHSLERMLLARLGDFLDAIAEGNVEFFERNLTDEAMLIFPGEGNTYTKAQCVASMVDHPVYHKYELTDPHIVHIGESTAVLTHRATVMHEQHERPMSVSVSTVLVHRDGEWRMALHQWTQ
ncbi:DUF4440 domain-containing protein [Actinophytocola glycyrrhizae]|uniref:DUF4440 domain-containing protein n=1 Tax=Actinophytocola glycyrrhizae TaxID=2044873 RepID=A0ABV9RZM5_9PSEU